MTISARFPPELAEQLNQFCREASLTKSHVVQEAVADYLVRARSARGRLRSGPASRSSEIFRAFEQVGMIGLGGVESGSVPQADKKAVRAAAVQRLSGKL